MANEDRQDIPSEEEQSEENMDNENLEENTKESDISEEESSEKTEEVETAEEISDSELPVQNSTDKKIVCEIEQEMKDSFLDYAMSVIVSRALPDVRDGLKPVHRRILYSMHESGFYFNKPYKKSARIVGDVLGRYHPHGDSSVYDALVRMVQTFSLRYPLVDGQGNFGSVDGDSAAAMRYTEARLAKIAADMLVDIEKETVDFGLNFDGSLKEPKVLPSRLPNLLLNGSSGIAVGMATNIPPHSITETCSAIIELIKNPELEIADLMEYIPGPDFPTGGIIIGKAGILSAYTNGRGIIKVRSKTDIERVGERENIIVNELPYQVNKAMLIEQIAELVRDKKVTDIRDLRDESDKDGTRVVIELKKGASSEIVLNQLFKHSRMEVSFGINMVALVGGKPQTIGLKTALVEYIKHRFEVIRRRTQFELDKAQKRLHILEGLMVALQNIDPIVQLIKSSASVQIAREGLMNNYDLSEAQANAILDMKLQKITSLETDKIKNEHEDLTKLVTELNDILASDERVNGLIIDDLKDIIDKFGDERRTEISDMVLNASDIEMEDLIEEHQVVVTISHSGYIKRIPLETYKAQNRGGKGIIAASTKEEDFLENVFVTSSHNYILFFSDKGKVYWKKVWKIPESTRQAKGQPVINLIEMEQGEKLTAFIPVRKFDEGNFLSLITEKGTIKKTSLDAYSKPRRGGIIAINLDEDDSLVSALLTDGSKQILVATKHGMAVKFHEANARAMGRTSHGVRAIRLKGDDKVIGAIVAEDNGTILTVTENGYGKRTIISEYRLINRGGSGVKNIICSERNGSVVGIKTVEDEDDIMIISQKGIIIRVPCRGISTIGRNTQGVRIMRMKSEEDRVMSIAKIVTEDDEELSEDFENQNPKSGESPAVIPTVEISEEDETQNVEDAEPETTTKVTPEEAKEIEELEEE